MLQVGRQLALSVDAGEASFLLLTGIASQRNRISVHDPDGRPITTVTVSNPADLTSISHLLMEALGIPEVRVPTSRRKFAARYTTVSFNDVFGYVYLSQSEIDRSTVNHLDAVRDPKRRSTFEVLYGLIDAEIADLQVQLGELADRISRAKSAVADIEVFVEQLDAPSEPALMQRLGSEAALITARERELELVRREMRDVSTLAQAARREGDRLAAELTDVVSQRERAAQQVEELERLRAQVVLDEQRTVRSMLAGSQLSAIEFRTCPRCLQSLNAREVPAGHCALCTQPEPTAVAQVTLEDELERLRGQLAETDELWKDAQRAAEQAARTVEELQESVTRARARADEEARNSVAPFVDRVAQLSEELGLLRGQQAATRQSLRLHAQFAARRAQLQELLRDQGALTARLQTVRSELEVGRARIDELSEAFDEILKDFRLPWYEKGYIDSTTYLPMVGGKRLEELSSGGMKTLVNDAYFLAGLTYALRVPSETHLPLLSIIDTPRKNFGSHPDDRRAADRIYRWLRRLQDRYSAGAFQLIVADNDVPTEAAEFPTRRLSYDKPLIDDLPHPGPDAVETLAPAG